MILDEGHKATSVLARQTIEGFDASIVIELLATPPKEANVLVRGSGNELLEEQMVHYWISQLPAQWSAPGLVRGDSK